MSALFRGFGYNSIQTVLWQLPNGAFQLMATVSAGLFASRFRNTTVLTSVMVHIPSLAGILGVALIPLQDKNRLALTACCWLLGVIGAAIILNWSIVASNFAGHSKRMTVNGINFVSYAAGNIIRPFMFSPSEAPRCITAVKTLCGIYASSMFFTAAIGAMMFRENRRRDRVAVGAVDGQMAANEIGFSDQTDRENRHFRYKL